MTAAATVDAATPAKEPIVLATEDAADEAALAALEAALEAAEEAEEEAADEADEAPLDAAEDELEEALEEEFPSELDFRDCSRSFLFFSKESCFGSLKVSETRNASPCPLIESSLTKRGFSLSIRMFCRSLLSCWEPSGFVILYVFRSSFTISHPYNIGIKSSKKLFWKRFRLRKSLRQRLQNLC